MKKQLLVLVLFAAALQGKSQTIATFDNLGLAPDSFWDGRYNWQAGGFSNGAAFFTNKWDTSFGGFWTGGFAYTSMKDSSDGTYNNLYSAITAGGYSGSSNYAVGQQGAVIRTGSGGYASGVYVTNATYPYKTIKNGDGFSKKFGGATGNDPDYFMMAFTAWKAGVKKPDTVKFYLADYRFSNNSQDYIVNNWTWVNLATLGNIDSLQITLFSSDTGSFGINTPTFFAIDNFTTDFFSSARPVSTADGFTAYPNPFSSELKLKNDSETNQVVSITDITGRLISEFPVSSFGTYVLSTADWAKGVYFANMKNESASRPYKIIKQ